jgi:hypothetical protein
MSRRQLGWIAAIGLSLLFVLVTGKLAFDSDALGARTSGVVAAGAYVASAKGVSVRAANDVAQADRVSFAAAVGLAGSLAGARAIATMRSRYSVGHDVVGQAFDALGTLLSRQPAMSLNVFDGMRSTSTARHAR